MAFFTMLFTSGKPVINIDSITEIKIKNNLFQSMIEISFIESGHIKTRGMVIEKDQMDNIVSVFLSEQLIEEKDSKANKKVSKRTIIVLLFIFVFYSFYKSNNPNVKMYFHGVIFTILTLLIVIKMIKNTVFLKNKITNKEKNSLQNCNPPRSSLD